MFDLFLNLQYTVGWLYHCITVSLEKEIREISARARSTSSATLPLCPLWYCCPGMSGLIKAHMSPYTTWASTSQDYCLLM